MLKKKMQRLFSKILKFLIAKFIFSSFIQYEMNLQPIPQTNNITFSSRCVYIRDAQWVNHAVNTTFPHFSTSKFKPLITKQLLTTFPDKFTPRNIPKTTNELFYTLRCIHLTKKDINNDKTFSFFQKIILKTIRSLLPAKKKQEFNRLAKSRNIIKKFGDLRDSCYTFHDKDLQRALVLLEEHKLGNCLEEATIAKLVLEINGIKNGKVAYLQNMKTNNFLDHAVCIFNKDGSEFDGKITNHTIVIDPWAEKADTAKNMLKYYQNTMQNTFDITNKTQVRFSPQNQIIFDENYVQQLKTKYPSLVFKSNSRQFMQK